MNNLRFLRNEASLTIRQLAEMTGLSFSYLSLIESGKKPFTEHCLDKLANALGVTKDFLEGKSQFGIFCRNGESAQDSYIPLSMIEYCNQSALGNIKTLIQRNPDMTAGQIEELKAAFPNDWEGIAEQAKRPFLERIILQPKQGKGSKAEAYRSEAQRLLLEMDEKQLEKALLIFKEVILK